MTVISNSRVFIDTNILIYLNTPSSTFFHTTIAKINDLSDADNKLFVSQQTLREYAHVTLRHAIYHKQNLSLAISDVLHNITQFQSDFITIEDSPTSFQNWLSLLPQLTTNKDVFDFNIAAMLQANRITHILTHNVSDFQKFSTWLMTIPLIEP